MRSQTFTYKKIWNITFPVLISLLMEDLIGLTDTAFLGRVGEVELGASAIAGIYYMAVYMIGFGFSVGAEILMGRRNGEKDYTAIGSIFYHGTVILLAMALAIVSLSKLFAGPVLAAAISSDEIYTAAMAYTNIRIYGLLFSFVAIMFRAYYMATTNTRTLTINGLVMVLSNVVMNYVLIFGKLGLPAMGIKGAAVGSVIAECISLLFFFIYTRARVDHRKYALFRRTRYTFEVQGQIFRIASWTMVQYFISTCTWLYFFLAIEHMGERPLAVSNIVRSVSTFFAMFVMAFASTGSALVSNLMGEGKAGEVRVTCRRIMAMCALMLLPLYLLAVAFPGLITRVYTDDPSLVSDTLASMEVMLLSYLVSVPAFILFMAVSGTGNTRHAFWMELTTMAIYVVYIYVVAIRLHMDIAVCWTSEWVYNIVLLVFTLLYFRYANWRKTKL